MDEQTTLKKWTGFWQAECAVKDTEQFEIHFQLTFHVDMAQDSDDDIIYINSCAPTSSV